MGTPVYTPYVVTEQDTRYEDIAQAILTIITNNMAVPPRSVNNNALAGTVTPGVPQTVALQTPVVPPPIVLPGPQPPPPGPPSPPVSAPNPMFIGSQLLIDYGTVQSEVVNVDDNDAASVVISGLGGPTIPDVQHFYVPAGDGGKYAVGELITSAVGQAKTTAITAQPSGFNGDLITVGPGLRATPTPSTTITGGQVNEFTATFTQPHSSGASCRIIAAMKFEVPDVERLQLFGYPFLAVRFGTGGGMGVGGIPTTEDLAANQPGGQEPVWNFPVYILLPYDARNPNYHQAAREMVRMRKGIQGNKRLNGTCAGCYPTDPSPTYVQIINGPGCTAAYMNVRALEFLTVTLP